MILTVWILVQWNDIDSVDTSTIGLYWQCGYYHNGMILAVWILAQWNDIGSVDTSTMGLYWQRGY